MLQHITYICGTVYAQKDFNWELQNRVMSDLASAGDCTSSAPPQTTSTGGAAGAQQPAMDFASILSKIQMLEKEKADMRAQLETTNSRLSRLQVLCFFILCVDWHLRRMLTMVDVQESKRSEMEQMMNSTITKWLANLETKDAASKVITLLPFCVTGCFVQEKS